MIIYIHIYYKHDDGHDKSTDYDDDHIWGFPKIVVPLKHPKMIIFSRKTHGCWVPPF